MEMIELEKLSQDVQIPYGWYIMLNEGTEYILVDSDGEEVVWARTPAEFKLDTDAYLCYNT
jgi:hypothetical protein